MLVLALITAVEAATPTFCTADVDTLPIATRAGPFSPSAEQLESAMRPALTTLQDVVCDCLPKRENLWPAQIKASAAVSPNAGTGALDVLVPPPMTDAKVTFIACVGEPEFRFEPFDFRSDMIVDGKSAPARFVYPLLVPLEAATKTP
ncbi:MAG: hypothetical protein KC912_16475 [Proteobacteria bacterium]|nr:hypothetical protein [Pseudomonadota bacterium]